MAYDMGGPLSPEDERMKRMMAARGRIAKSSVPNAPVQPQKPQMAAAPSGKGGPLQGLGKELGKKALMGALGPLGGILGGLFNEGGKVPWWKKAWGSRSGKKGSIRDQIGWNIGGPISTNYGLNTGGNVPNPNMMGPLNPNGYNEGGPAPSTPIKRVMDEDKIEIQRETFERAEARKDEKFKMDEQRAAEKHKMDMKMKKQASVTNKAPLAKK